MKRFVPMLLSVVACSVSSAESPRLRLALDFLDTGDGSAAALEFRRLAADEADPETRIHYYLGAADAYRTDGDWARMSKMLDHADEEQASLRASIPYAWLRLRQAEGTEDWGNASLWAQSLAAAAADPSKTPPESAARLREIALRTAAADALLADDPDEARRIASTPDFAAAPLVFDALTHYGEGSDRSPTVGGLLGLVPGLGYAYSGEWGNAVRSLVLNGLFGWAVYQTAADEEWGLFAVATFFELTWYSGSVYGGIDAAYRYNRDRRLDAAAEIRGEGELRPESPRGVDLFRFRFAF